MSDLRVERCGDSYSLVDEVELWRIELQLPEVSASPFREELVWITAGVVAIAGGSVVHLVGIDSGSVKASVRLGDDLFGHFALDSDVLYVLGWRRVTAIARDLATRWVSLNISIDGIVWRGRDGNRIILSAEMDPPGGWIDVELEVTTGRELRRGRAQ